MDFDDLLFPLERTDEQIQYLISNFEKIDEELFNTFEINPITEEGLKIMSMTYADFCLKLYPLLTIAFQVHSFRSYYSDYFQSQFRALSQGELTNQFELEDIVDEMYLLREKNKQNKDHIRDYYKLHKKFPNRIWPYFDINTKLILKRNVGRIMLEYEIQPFKKKYWNKYLDVRNKIQHQGVILASLNQVLTGFSALYLLVESLCYSEGGIIFEFESMICGEVKSTMDRGYNLST